MEKEREYLELGRDNDKPARYVLGRHLYKDFDCFLSRDWEPGFPCRIDLPPSLPIPPSLQLKPGEGPVRVQLRRVR